MSKTSLRAGTEMSHQFDLQVPGSAPPTYEGDICRVRWTLGLTLKRRLRRPEVHEFPVVVLQPRNGRFPVLQASTQSNSPENCFLYLELGGRQAALGQEISGVLRVEPRRSFTADKVRVELIRHERVSGSRGKTQLAVEDLAVLEENAVFQMHIAREFTFQLLIPPTNRPSYFTPHSSAYWEISAVLTRPRQAEFRVSAQLDVFSTPLEAASD